MDLLCAVRLPGCGVAREDYELVGESQYNLKWKLGAGVLPAWFLCFSCEFVVLRKFALPRLVTCVTQSASSVPWSARLLVPPALLSPQSDYGLFNWNPSRIFLNNSSYADSQTSLYWGRELKLTFSDWLDELYHPSAGPFNIS